MTPTMSIPDVCLDTPHAVVKNHKHVKRKSEIHEYDSQKKRKSDKPPTVEELNELKETENLFNNNKFRLLIQELSRSTRIKNKYRHRLSLWLIKFDKFINNLQDYNILLPSDKQPNLKNDKNEIWSKLSKYKRIYQTDNDIELLLTKPEKYFRFGLYENNCLPAPNIVLNIALVMPKTCFRVKDFLNNRYLTKRYYYLAYIAEKMREIDSATKVTFTYYEDNHLLPILNVVPSTCDKTTIRIFAVPSEETFKPSRFTADQNNIKLDLFDMGVGNKIIENIPTVLYNSILAHDVTLLLNNNFIEETLKEQNSIQEGIKLLSVWLTQRELNVGICSFTENLLLYFIVYLIHKKKINKYMSSYQVIRNFWGFLSTTDLYKNPINLTDVPELVLSGFKENFDIICLDKSGYYNYAAFLNLEIYKKVKMECQKALENLDQVNDTQPFLNLFLIKYPFYLQYDLIVDLSDSLPLEKNKEISIENYKLLGYNNIMAVEYVMKILKRAFNNRIQNIVPRLESENGILKKLFFGVNLNPDEAFNFIEKGPDMNDFAAAAEFNKFWGELASNRRFKDGSVKVAVVFKTNTVKGKRNVIEKILNFILNTRMQLKYRLFYNRFDEFVEHKRLALPYPSGTNEETTLAIIRISDDLVNKLRSLELPLKIVSVQSTSDIFCFTDVFPPIPTNYEVKNSLCTTLANNIVFSEKKAGLVPRLAQPIQFVLQLEHSSKWPNNLEAMQHLKTSFYLKMSDMLAKDHKIISHVTPNFLELFYQGLVFRFSFNIAKEIGLMKREIRNSIISYEDTKESLEMDKTFNVLPKVISALKGLNSLHPSFGLGTCIMKRWLRAHLLDDAHIPDIVLNLLNASLYLSNEVSCSPQISFLRFLKFFVEFSWHIQTVVVNFNDDITKEEITSVEEKLLQNRTAYPPLYIIMQYDQGLSIFTKKSPSVEVLMRIQILAKDSLKLVGDAIMNQTLTDFGKIFTPSTEGYDVIIYLKPLLNARRHEQINFSHEDKRQVVEKYHNSSKNRIPIVNFDPVQSYLKELRDNYGNYALFFHDTYGGSQIFVLFYRNLLENKDFKVNQINASKRSSSKQHSICFNMDAVIEDFFIIGGDLIQNIETKSFGGSTV